MNKQKPPFERLAVFLFLIVIERNDLSAVVEERSFHFLELFPAIHCNLYCFKEKQ
jgi:hypothetical protein